MPTPQTDAKPHPHTTKRSRVERLTLSLNDQLFLDEYFRNGRNATDAYRKVHPNCKYESGAAAACNLLKSRKLQQGIAQRLSEVRYDLPGIQDEITYVVREAKANGELKVMLEALMDYAKLAGYLVDKREDVTQRVRLTKDQIIAELKARFPELVPELIAQLQGTPPKIIEAQAQNV